MGMESFFVVAVPKAINIIEKKELDEYNTLLRKPEYKGETNLTLQAIKNIFSEKNIKCKEYHSGFSLILNDLIIMDWIEQNEQIVEIHFEACFSWFPDSLDYCIELISLINEKVKMKYYQIDYSYTGEFFPQYFKFSEVDMFKQVTIEYYQTKYKHFLERYNIKNEKIAPDHFFYKKVNSPFRWLFNFYGRKSVHC